jgi:hypothetical protein
MTDHTSYATAQELAADVQRTQLGLDVVWCGRLTADGPLVGIVHDPLTDNRYSWPGLKAWRGALPGYSAECATPRAGEQKPARAPEVRRPPSGRTKQQMLF